MDQDYWKFLNAKLYLIEQISLKEMLNGNEKNERNTRYLFSQILRYRTKIKQFKFT